METGEKKSLIRRLKDVPPVRLIVSSFFIIIVIGAVLLALPISARDRQATDLLSSFFTSTSATCVTGLVVFDTWTHWSAFGQGVILGLIQLGGLGLVTFTSGFTLFLRRRLALRDMQIAKEYTNGSTLDLPRLLRTIMFFTFVCEAFGSFLLMLRFVPMFGGKGIWISVFLSVSAYCNAGFDILGFLKPDASLELFVGDPLVCLTICCLIILGGIGFIVTVDLYNWGRKRVRKEERRPHLTLHTRIVLVSTASLLVLGTVLTLGLEYDHTLKDLNFWEKLNASFFQSVTARTAGYATIPQGELGDATKLVTIILMFIGVFYFGLEAVLYTLLAFFVMFKTCNAFTDGFDYKKNIIIISEHYEEIGNGIIEVIGRGVTYLYAEGAYTHQQRKVLLNHAKLTQVAKIKQIVRDIDPGCFMIIQDANDVFGKGFTSKPSAHKKNKKIFCTVDTLKQKS